MTSDYAQTAGGTFAVEVNGTTAGTEFDQLVVADTVSLAGTLTVDTSGFTPTPGQKFRIIDAPNPPPGQTRTGTFTTVQETGADYEVLYKPTNVTLAIPSNADLGITKTDSPDPVGTSSTLTYTLTVSNAGPDPVADPVVTDVLPLGTTLQSATGSGWSCSGTTTVTCERSGSVAAGSSAPPITIQVTTGSLPSLITNTASVTADAVTDSNPLNNTATETTQVVDERVDLAVAGISDNPDPVVTGAPLSYTVDVTNQGGSDSFGVVLDIFTPSGSTNVVVSGDGWDCVFFGFDWTQCTRPELAAGASAPVTVQLDAPSFPGPAFLFAQVIDSNFDEITFDNNFDFEETEVVESTSQCSDGIDNDGDTLVDFGSGPGTDPGCTSAGDDSENTENVNPECSDEIDNDGDGDIDHPTDLGCRNAGDDTESSETDSECSNEVDDDGDGLIDFGSGPGTDPGCTSAGDDSENTENVNPECSDEIDNDGDGDIDHPTDLGCRNAGDDTESSETDSECSNEVDDDGDGLIDFGSGPGTDPGCTSAGDDSENTENVNPECSDEIDNDGDGDIDHPTDLGCRNAGDDTESSETDSECSNEVDDDGDGLIDFGSGPGTDPGCTSAGDDSENTENVNPECSDEIDNDGDGDIDHPTDLGCRNAGDDTESSETDSECSNEVDDDGDGLIDFGSGPGTDPGCTSAGDDSENTENVNPECSDEIDNDGDGDIDHPTDLGCRNAGDDTESSETDSECSNEVDDDGDGDTDFPADNGCLSAADNSEDTDANEQCSDEIDNDLDGQTDHPDDPGCRNPDDNTESSEDDPQCSNEVDDDFDGDTDFPADNGCLSAADNSEDTDANEQCSDEIDNDLDGQTDHPDDPGCRNPDDNTENSESQPQCSDEVDNDGDGKIDFGSGSGNDPGCVSATDNTENTNSNPQCSDELDNDGDGKIDFGSGPGNDPGCRNASDNTENSESQPQCSDEVDNDGDGKIDFGSGSGNDPGCSSASDNSENSDSNRNVVVADPSAFGGSGGVIRVNPTTGARTTVSRNSSPTGSTSFVDPIALVFESNGRIVVADRSAFGGTGGVIRVHPQTGVRTTVSSNSSPSGSTKFEEPTSIAVEANGNIIVADADAFGGTGGIIRVNPVTGARTTVSKNSSPTSGSSELLRADQRCARLERQHHRCRLGCVRRPRWRDPGQPDNRSPDHGL